MSTAAEDQPKLVSHCAILYAKLDAECNNERIWSGKMISTCASLGINAGSYSRVVNALRRLGCIEQLEKGYRARPSMYRIHFPPTPEVWAQNAPDRTEDLTSAPSSDTMAARLRDLEIQLGGINVVAALATIEGEVKGLRKEVQELRREVSTARQQQ